MRRARPDHPRACGANVAVPDTVMTSPGSSPRVRGKQRPIQLVEVMGRIIPARAGQTSWTGGRRFSCSDHPRACGANRRDGGAAGDRAGSSPRVRGKPRRRNPNHRHHRIIPARAGQTTLRFHSTFRSSDHPRACGANRTATTNEDVVIGSSPRVRGKRLKETQTEHIHRIIPARAGQTTCPNCRRRACPDHPRACGANTSEALALPLTVGSSPRVRGKQVRRRGSAIPCRIIPARAGQTDSLDPGSMFQPDHPRACGANWANMGAADANAGSSPRVRGKHRGWFWHTG